MKKLLLALFVSGSLWAAAIGPQTVWEVRLSNGSDDNGGGFDWGNANLAAVTSQADNGAGHPRLLLSDATGIATNDLVCITAAPSTATYLLGCHVATAVDGTHIDLETLTYTAGVTTGAVLGDDYSQSNTAKFSGVDGATDGSGVFSDAAGSPHAFVQADVGNAVQITACTGGSLTAGIYTITSVATGAATLNASPGTSLSGCTWFEGGALLTIGKLAGVLVGSNHAWIKAEATITTGAITFAQAAVTPSATVMPSTLSGYTTTRGDGGRAYFKATTNSMAIFTFSNGGWKVENFDLDGNTAGSKTSVTAISFKLYYFDFQNLKIHDFTGGLPYGLHMVDSAAYVSITDSEFTNLGACAVCADSALSRIRFSRNYVHANSGTPLSLGGSNVTGLTAEANIFYSNTGATTDCIASGATISTIERNIVDGCGRDGIRLSTSAWPSSVRDNLIVNYGASAAGCGLSGATAAFRSGRSWDTNAFYDGNSRSCNRNNFDDRGSVSRQNGVNFYTDVGDIVLAANPFVSDTTGNFALTPAAIAALSGKASYNAWPGLSGTVGYAVIGPVQPQTGGAGGGTYVWGK